MPWYIINPVFNWSLVLGVVVFFGYSCAWLGAMWDRQHHEPEPCGRKHRDEL